jgi:hypothetical protein
LDLVCHMEIVNREQGTVNSEKRTVI